MNTAEGEGNKLKQRQRFHAEENNRANTELAADNLRLHQEIDAFWTAIHRSWNIEPRSYFEAEAPKNGFGSPLAMAVHYMWKREVKELDAVATTKRAMIAKVRLMKAREEVGTYPQGYGIYDFIASELEKE